MAPDPTIPSSPLREVACNLSEMMKYLRILLWHVAVWQRLHERPVANRWVNLIKAFPKIGTAKNFRNPEEGLQVDSYQ